MSANNSSPISDPFGCCSRYRACSDARCCVISDRDYSSFCLYRKNLEAGRIFYGKNSANFSAPAYDDFLKKYRSLSPDEQLEFQSVVGLFTYWRNGSAEELLFVTPGILRAGEIGLFELKRDPRRVLSMFNLRYLKERFSGIEIPDGLTREQTADFLLSKDPDTAHALTDSMAYLCVSPHMRTYYVEFYYDFMECESQPPKPDLPLEQDNPNILREFRRTPASKHL